MAQPDQTDAAQGPLFSVLIATYDQASYILETLDTVAAQSCGDYELVVVNDGSTDDTEELVTNWMDRFRAAHRKRAVLATIPNSGQSAAMEHGFGLCEGRYICLLDSDDRWLPDKLERVSRAAAAHPEAGMIIHPLYVIDADGRRTGDVRPKEAKLSRGDIRAEVRRTSRHVAPATSGVVIRADVFGELVPMPTKEFRAAADFYLTLGAAVLAPIAALDEPLGEYRMHPSGQHIQTMLSPDGVRRWVELQTTIARHFGLEGATSRNSYFMRHVFVRDKLERSARHQLSSFLHLLRATWVDTAFGMRMKLMFTGYWAVCFLAPRPVFRRLWRAFMLKQTGFDRTGLATSGTLGGPRVARTPVS